MVKNPFILAPYVSKELFCDRKEEMDNILQYLRNGRNITLISPRRLGKTGLIYRVFDEIKTDGAEFDTIYVDISHPVDRRFHQSLCTSRCRGHRTPQPHSFFFLCTGWASPPPELRFHFRFPGTDNYLQERGRKACHPEQYSVIPGKEQETGSGSYRRIPADSGI